MWQSPENEGVAIGKCATSCWRLGMRCAYQLVGTRGGVESSRDLAYLPFELGNFYPGIRWQLHQGSKEMTRISTSGGGFLQRRNSSSWLGLSRVELQLV